MCQIFIGEAPHQQHPTVFRNDGSTENKIKLLSVYHNETTCRNLFRMQLGQHSRC